MLGFGFYNMDCMDGMKEFPDKYFDLAIVDPPYGIGADTGTGGFGVANPKHYRGGWDGSVPNREYFKELERVSRNRIIWGGQYMIKYLQPSTKWIVWDKVGEGRFNNPYSKCELAWTSFPGVVDKFVCVQMGFVSEDKSERIHPTQKPIALYQWILTNYAKDGDKILDTHVGSASSLIACYNLGFDCVGFEIDKGYYQLAQERLDEVKAQMRFI